MIMGFTDNELSLQLSVSRKQKTLLELSMVNINTYDNEKMVPIQFCGNIFFWVFSVVDHKSVTDAGLIDSFLANPSLLKSNFCIRV